MAVMSAEIEEIYARTQGI